MKVLVCDDDSSSRFMVRRLLEESFACEVTECADGVEALELLARERFGFVMLDLEMPTMSGLETLEEIRESSQTRDVPVIILSRERQEEAVMELMRLGISDYLLKPLRNHLALTKIEKVISMLPRKALAATELERIRLASDTPALLVDGNLDYRYFFTTQLQRYGRVVQADSGAAALSLCRRNSFRLVFVGGDLGIVSSERIARKLRELHPVGIRLIRIADGPLPVKESKLFDAVVARSYLPDTFRALMRPFVFIPGPYSALMELVPELPSITSSAAAQVFGMMFDAEVTPSKDASPIQVAASSVLDIELADRFELKLGVHLTKAAGAAAAAKMMGIAPADVTDEDCESVAGELGNIVTGRVHARFTERQMKSKCSLPVLTQGAGAYAVPDEARGLLQRFAMPQGQFVLTVTVTDRRADEVRSALGSAASAAAGDAGQAEGGVDVQSSPDSLTAAG